MPYGDFWSDSDMQIFTKKRVIVAAVLLALGGGAVVMMKPSADKTKEQLPRYRTAVVDTGNLTQTVTASGTLNPVALVNVGSQVSGQVSELNADFNDRVKKGQMRHYLLSEFGPTEEVHPALTTKQ